MTTRGAFDRDLEALEEQLRGMTTRVASALRDSVRSLITGDSTLADQVIAGDEDVNQLWSAMQRDILVIIARRQPMATDLREVLACFAITSDLERIGDHAKSIARVARSSQPEPPERRLVTIPRMGDLCAELLSEQVHAFLERDAARAAEISTRDNELDRLFELAFDHRVAAMKADSADLDRASRLIGVAKNLERVGDHITNIGEWAVFRATGRLVELNA